MSVTIGMKGSAEALVCESNTAQAAGSARLGVFASPWKCGLKVRGTRTRVAPGLEEGESTVGTKLDVSHDSATPLGLKVWAESEVTEVDGKRILFQVTAYDERGPIGKGTHERFIITDRRFLDKAARKLEG